MSPQEFRQPGARYRGSDFALTADEYLGLSHAAPPPAKRSPKFYPQRECRTYVDLNGEPLNVMFDRDALVFFLAFRGATALLDLTEARHIAAVLNDTLDDWRAGPHGGSGAGATAAPEVDDRDDAE